MPKFKISSGFVYGKKLQDLFDFCKKTHCALPSVNVTSSNTINAALSAAKEAQTPIILQFSHSGAAFFAGKNLDNTKHVASILGAASAAMYVKALAKAYGVAVILHTDHCPKEKLAWIDGLIDIGADYYQSYAEPLFSSHMLDLSALSLEENLRISESYLKKMAPMETLLEIEVGLTGGEEDGLDNTGANKKDLYSQPTDVVVAHERLSKIGAVSIAAAFGNVHGVYKPGAVDLEPKILRDCQALAQQKMRKNATTRRQKLLNLLKQGHLPLNLVFHGGSGSEVSKIKESLQYGVVKFNIDTDTQWAFTEPIKEYMDKNDQYLHSQLGNSSGKDKPNKAKIDPRVWLAEGEAGMTARLVEAFSVLSSQGKFSIED